jgi:hypothetical protein
MAKNLNLAQKITLNIGQTKDFLKTMIKIGGTNQSFYLEGPSGIGKSEMIIQLAKELNMELIDIRLGNLDVIDLNGIGIPDVKNKKAIWTRPEIFPPQESETKYLFFLDEFNHASDQVFGAAYQLVLERRMGTHILPPNVLIIGAGNGISDQGIAFSMPKPLVNRFTKVNTIPDIDDWLTHADTIDIDWKIKGFLKAQNEFLHKFDANSDEDNFPTPRNWVRFNSFINELKDNEQYLKVLLNGLFGYSLMVQFNEYLKLIEKLPILEDILNGTNTNINTITDLSSSMAFSMLVKHYLKNNLNDTTNNQLLNLFKYINIQPNKEVMQMLNIEILSIINSSENITIEKREDFQYFIYQNIEQLKDNKEFIIKLKEFSKNFK